MNKSLILFFIVIAFYIFLQTSFFPEPIANLLIRIFEPELSGTTIVSSPMVFVRYQNIVIHAGLLISVLCVFQAARLYCKHFISTPTVMARSTFLVFKLAAFTLVYLMTLKNINLIMGKNLGLFEISSDALLMLVVFLIFPLYGFIQNERKCRKSSG